MGFRYLVITEEYEVFGTNNEKHANKMGRTWDLLVVDTVMNKIFSDSDSNNDYEIQEITPSGFSAYLTDDE